ncbi:MAG: hypothetical protein OXL34_13945 [Gemmatimonadota bacterium]|nr:hypothetical protein [Gemmatimonadota bacterium]
MTHRTIFLAVFAFRAAPFAASAQGVTVLTEDICATCSIELLPDVVLGTDGESVIGLALDIARLSDGRFAFAFDDVMYEFTVFSADGSESRRVGRAGEGPGEYGHVWFVREHDRLRLAGPTSPPREGRPAPHKAEQGSAGASAVSPRTKLPPSRRFPSASTTQ